MMQILTKRRRLLELSQAPSSGASAPSGLLGQVLQGGGKKYGAA